MSSIFNTYTSYPGWYSPPSEVNALIQHFAHFQRVKHQKIQAEIHGFEHHYMLSIPAAVSKNDVVVYAHRDQLLIALKKQPTSKRRPHSKKKAHYVLNIINIPQDADVEFASAECKKGVLEICLFRTGQKQPDKDHQILVY